MLRKTESSSRARGLPRTFLVAAGAVAAHDYPPAGLGLAEAGYLVGAHLVDDPGANHRGLGARNVQPDDAMVMVTARFGLIPVLHYAG